MKMRLFVLFALLAYSPLLSSSSPAEFEYCEGFVPNADQPGYLAPKLPNRFQTQYESYFGDRIISYKLFYDYDERKAAVETTAQNVKNRIIVDFETNEIHMIQEPASEGGQHTANPSRTCTTQSMNSFTPNPQIGLEPFQKVNSTYFILRTASEILDFDASTYRYDGLQKINGIVTDRYSSCKRYNLGGGDDSSILIKNSTLFFTLPDAKMPLQNSEFTRILVQGVFEIKESGFDVTSVNNYYEFRPMIEIDDEHFRTPPGLYCKNRTTSRPLPEIPNQFKYSEELHHTTGGYLTYLRDVYYNQKFNMVRYESTNPKAEKETFYTRDPLRSIHDFSTGVSFTLNLLRGNCSITPLTLFTFDVDVNFTENIFNTMNNSFVIRMKSPASFLLLDSDYVLTAHGRRVNNLPTNVYVSNRVDPTTKGDLISEVSFLADEFADVSYSHSVPISLSLMNSKNESSYFSFYGFDISAQDLSPFDVSKCFPRDDLIEFKIKYPLFSFKDVLNQSHLTNLAAIKATFIQLLMNTTEESRTRFSNPSIFINNGFIYLRSAILPRPPVLSYFTLLQGYWLPSSESTFKPNVDNEEMCAGYCIESPVCLSFEYGSNTKGCFLNKKHGTSGLSNASSTVIRHYSRNTVNGFTSRDSSSVWKIVTDSVADNLLKLEIIVAELNNQVFVLEPASIDLVQMSAEDALGTTNALKKYNLKFSNRQLPEPTDLYTFVDTSLDYCARECSNPNQVECNTFSYCAGTGRCSLSSLKWTTDESTLIASDECDIYEKDSLFNYAQFPGQSGVNKKDDLEYTQVKDPSECAVKCNSELKIHCRSFNYCPNRQACYLSSKHSVDSVSEGLSEDFVCTHYSRNFLSDFVYTATADIELVGDIVYQKSNLEECSRYCVSTDAFSCKSFDYCASSRVCLLHKGLTGGRGDSSSSGIKTQRNIKERCVNYKREYFYLTSMNADKQKESDDKSGLLIGLSIGSGLAGAILGAVSLMFFLKKRK